MCYGSHCPYEIKGGPYVGECTLRGEELLKKCPADDPERLLIPEPEITEDDLDNEIPF
jgi:hypothetical protein